MRKILISLIRLYQYAISPYFPPSCRYIPTCSTYSVEAISRFGILRGSLMALRRIGRCHPWHEGGYDPVPEKKMHGHNCQKEHGSSAHEKTECNH